MPFDEAGSTIFRQVAIPPEDDGDPPADELAERLFAARYARLADMISPGTLAREAREALRAAEAFRQEQRRLWLEADVGRLKTKEGEA